MSDSDIDGIFGPKTQNYLISWQKSKWLKPDGIWGYGSDGTAFPIGIHGCDYSMARPDPNMLNIRGVVFAARYLASTENAKTLYKSEYDRLNNVGIAVPYIYEEDGTELTGFDAGVRVARLAEQYRLREGLPAKPIYFNVDYDAESEQYPMILESLKGIASVIGRKRTGLYAGYYVIKAAFDAELITWGFQTRGWSMDKNGRVLWDPRAQLQQWANDQFDGMVDFTRAMTSEYGQNPVH